MTDRYAPAAAVRYRAAPRPLAVQRLAAELVIRCHGPHHRPIGAICDALTVGIDPAVWSARAVTKALNTDMRATGWSRPDHIDRAVLAHRRSERPETPCRLPRPAAADVSARTASSKAPRSADGHRLGQPLAGTPNVTARRGR